MVTWRKVHTKSIKSPYFLKNNFFIIIIYFSNQNKDNTFYKLI
jgi:hypothetical protein